MSDERRIPVWIVECATEGCAAREKKRTVYAPVDRGMIYLPRVLCRYCMKQPKLVHTYDNGTALNLLRG